ncbi:radical SAM protein [Burkholderia cepacia]|uniref:radical SAM/SPASM domain-containing protein n=1 Tax=Burkholderia cepacia TaxID=292 RepID=UPI000F592599|nr:radical SAM protein [Burkholderia cepacia]RQT46702.1 radical SAM protein [Burkholderia cepacia]
MNHSFATCELSAPLHIDFEITGRCQLDCSYCSAAPLGQPDVPTDRAIALLAEMHRIGVFSLLMSGGEPTLHRDFVKIAAAASRSVRALVVNTNGIRFSREKLCAEFADAAPNALVAISLDSADSAASNSSRGTGAELAMKAIANCSALGLPVCISAVLTEKTFSNAAELVDRFAPKVNLFRFFPRVPRDENDLLLNNSAYIKSLNDFYACLRTLAINNPAVEVLTPSGNARNWEAEGEKKTATECVCSTTRLYIDRKLDVYPCYYSAHPDNLIGSCEYRSLEELWKTEKARSIREKSARKRLCGASPGPTTIPIRYQQHIRN